MTATVLYEIVTGEDADGTRYPVEYLWTPDEDAVDDNGFIAHRSLWVAGVGVSNEDSPYPGAFVVLGHQRWADIIEAAAAYMARVHGWRNLHLYPGDDPSVLIPRIPRAVHAHGVFLRHPHPDHACGCEWDETWRLVWTQATEPAAGPITAMRHPAAPATTASLPNPDEGAPATWAA
ncbi:hypothetical protein ACH4GK_37415 [Streptomyces rimosus]|uniref:hypothetical protein n=1 Tax=Streptomyces rimosus TaxID=1927 RepID=UPI0004C8D17A|nr:hypothetical protein [Streptomyces rimosus]